MCKKLCEWMNKKIKKFDWLDIGCIKWSTAVLVLFLAKMFPVLTEGPWYVYIVLCLALGYRPWKKFFSK